MKLVYLHIVFFGLWLQSTHAQHIVHNLDFVVDGTRQGISNGLAYRIQVQKAEVVAGASVMPVQLIRDAHFAPGIFLGGTYNWLQLEKVVVGSSLFYRYKWNLTAQNPMANAHEFFYSYRISVGKKWKFFHELGLGAHCRTANIDKFVWFLDGRISFGCSYAF